MRGDESNRAARRIGSVNEPPQRVKDDLDVPVMVIASPFKLAEFAREISVVDSHLAQAHKSAHDGDIDCTARSLFSTAESMATPSWVNANGW